jgi:hypothetical protein
VIRKKKFLNFSLSTVNPVGIIHGALNPVHKSRRFLNLSSPRQAMGHSYGVNLKNLQSKFLRWMVWNAI